MISVGIDVSKGKSMVCMLKPGGEVVAPPYEMLHTMESVLLLADRIKSFPEETRVVLEDTGHYHWPVVKVLTEKGIFVTSVNALRMKRYCSQDLRGAKTDRKDSIRIASYGLTYWSELTPVLASSDTYRELRLLSRQYQRKTALMASEKVNFSNLLDRVMPGLPSAIHDNRGKERLYGVAARYGHYGQILEMGEKKFTSDFCKWAKKQGYRTYERMAKELFAIAQTGIPALPNSTAAKATIKEAVRLIQEIESSRKVILTQMIALAKTLPEFSVVREMNCMGDALTAGIIAEIGDVTRFHSKHALIAYAGIDAPPYQSGTFNAMERHISKRGNRYLRKVGYQVIQSVIMHKPQNDPVYEFIEKKRSEGKTGKEAMIAGLNKFLRIYYGKVSEVCSNINHQLLFGSRV